MKVYDTDEQAIAKGARQKMLARVIQTLFMLAFSGLGLWLFYSFVLAPKKSAELVPTRVMALILFPRDNGQVVLQNGQNPKTFVARAIAGVENAA